MHRHIQPKPIIKLMRYIAGYIIKNTRYMIYFPYA